MLQLSVVDPPLKLFPTVLLRRLGVATPVVCHSKALEGWMLSVDASVQSVFKAVLSFEHDLQLGCSPMWAGNFNAATSTLDYARGIPSPTADRICFIFVVFDRPQRGRTLQGLGHFGEVSRLQGTLEKCQNGSLDMKPLLNMSQKRSDQNPFCWFAVYRGCNTTQLFWDYNKPF